MVALIIFFLILHTQNRSTTENTGSIARQCNFSLVQLLVLAMMTTSKKNMHENTIIKTGQQRKTLVSLLTMQFFMLNCFCYQWRLVSASNSNWTEEKLHCEQWNQYFLLLNIFFKFVSVTNHFICSQLNATLFRVKERTVMTEHDKTST